MPVEGMVEVVDSSRNIFLSLDEVEEVVVDVEGQETATESHWRCWMVMFTGFDGGSWGKRYHWTCSDVDEGGDSNIHV